MENNIQDKQFMALELTKILYGDNKGLNTENIYTSYTYFLKQLTETFDELETIDAIKNELDKLRKENERYKNDNQADITRLCEDIMCIITGARGDMEPYVYNSLTNIIKSKIQ